MTQNSDLRTLSICGILVTKSEFSRNLCQVNACFLGEQMKENFSNMK